MTSNDARDKKPNNFLEMLRIATEIASFLTLCSPLGERLFSLFFG
jgi:hypothetical protein